jgi:type I restriction enzyme M protein
MLRRLDGVLAPTKEKVLQTVGKLEPPSDDKDKKVGKVGYGINFNRYFYRYTPPRPLEKIEADIIEADIKGIEKDVLDMLREVAG